MKILLYILAFLILLVIGVYKYFVYNLIEKQESSFAAMSELNFKESPRTFPDSIKMADEQFWKLIDSSKSTHPDVPKEQVDLLISSLSKMPDKKIIGFECTFREKMVELWDYNIKSLYQITEEDNYISTDDFVYYRAYLISLGRRAYDQALRNTDDLNIKINRSTWSGEEMIAVADRAFEKKHGKLDENNCPRCIAAEVDYDFGNYKMKGVYVSPDDFNEKYPNLKANY